MLLFDKKHTCNKTKQLGIMEVFALIFIFLIAAGARTSTAMTTMQDTEYYEQDEREPGMSNIVLSAWGLFFKASKTIPTQ